jgi:hypothetical protein
MASKLKKDPPLSSRLGEDMLRPFPWGDMNSGAIGGPSEGSEKKMTLYSGATGGSSKGSENNINTLFNHWGLICISASIPFPLLDELEKLCRKHGQIFRRVL